MTGILRVALITLGNPNTLTGGYLYHRRLAALAPRYDARIKFISFPQRPFPLAVIDAPRMFRRASGMGADVIVLDSIAAAFAGPWLVINKHQLPLVGMLHQPPGGIDHGSVRTWAQSKLDRLAYRKADLLLVASESLLDEVAAQGISRAGMRVVPPGRDVATGSYSPHEPAKEQPLREPKPRPDLRRGRQAAALCVANWVERKGIHGLLEALSGLPDDVVTLHLVGDDHADERYADGLRQRLRRPDLSGRVMVHGPLPAEKVAALYAAADFFVLPSTKEPYGTVYGEAMSAGLPVVGWRAGNLPYLAENEREGLLVATGDIAGLGEAISRLALDEALRLRLGQAARQRAQTRPTWDETAQLFFSAIREVCPIDRQGPRRPVAIPTRGSTAK
jgi:glycosyltransferase involved in cell wall biosynthesis